MHLVFRVDYLSSWQMHHISHRTICSVLKIMDFLVKIQTIRLPQEHFTFSITLHCIHFNSICKLLSHSSDIYNHKTMHAFKSVQRTM